MRTAISNLYRRLMMDNPRLAGFIVALARMIGRVRPVIVQVKRFLQVVGPWALRLSRLAFASSVVFALGKLAQFVYDQCQHHEETRHGIWLWLAMSGAILGPLFPLAVVFMPSVMIEQVRERRLIRQQRKQHAVADYKAGLIRAMALREQAMKDAKAAAEKDPNIEFKELYEPPAVPELGWWGRRWSWVKVTVRDLLLVVRIDIERRDRAPEPIPEQTAEHLDEVRQQPDFTTHYCPEGGNGFIQRIGALIHPYHKRRRRTNELVAAYAAKLAETDTPTTELVENPDATGVKKELVRTGT